MTRRPNNLGMHQIISGPRRPYGKCPRCKQMKPQHWVSKTHYLCYSCLKQSGKQRYYPTLAKESAPFRPDVEVLSNRRKHTQRRPF